LRTSNKKKDVPNVDDIDEENKSNVRHNEATKSIMKEINNSKIGYVEKHKELNLHPIQEPPLKKLKTSNTSDNNNNNNEENNKEKKNIKCTMFTQQGVWRHLSRQQS